MSARRSLLIAALCGCFAIPAFAQSTSVHLRGTIDAVDGGSMQVTTRSGQQQTLAMASNLVVAQIVAIGIAEIQPNAYIGTATVPQPDGTWLAREVQVFPESMRGVGDGDHAWDVEPGGTMTNGTVGTVTGTSGRTLTVRYKGGEKQVVVPAHAPIVTYAPGTPAMLVPGAHVIITATQNSRGSLVATRVGVGKDGLVPPM